ncbi:enolase C-terminal domain-like protein [Pontibacter flavimaris]|uniref:Mandelate racemase/muconate lactonizing enzyme C-terminal domain-containing protein n=1 Tax=Pontibacter flavimaris TaxID=1797110 RepID=A0A1Q5PB43_9BACT|nr:enolase C-terminal domain-like protein [Pontibacter flavimaris]OKL39427.1 hypothetical protein A3841_02360 [Pontibacter flavimaris]
MLKWHIEVLHLKLKHTSSFVPGTQATRVNFLVQVSDGEFSGFGEAAPDARYGETPELLLQQYKVLLMGGMPQMQSMEELLQLLEQLAPINALRFAIEGAYLHYFCQHKGVPVHQLLGQPVPQPQITCFTLPALQPGEVAHYLHKYNLGRFRYLKLRVDPEQGPELVQEVLRATEQPLVLDGHESWLDAGELLDFLNALERGRILFMEQPMPASKAAAYAQIKNISPVPLVADESVTDLADLELLRTQFHGISITPMRAGGYLNTVRLLQEAKKYGLMTVLGSGIETTLGAWSSMQLSSAFNFVDLDGFLMLEEEPFGLVHEQEGVLYLK